MERFQNSPLWPILVFQLIVAHLYRLWMFSVSLSQHCFILVMLRTHHSLECGDGGPYIFYHPRGRIYIEHHVSNMPFNKNKRVDLQSFRHIKIRCGLLKVAYTLKIR